VSQSRLELDSPKIFHALGRFIEPRALDQLASDYNLAIQAGANTEFAHHREQGVSFNPRVARIISILIHDGDVRELLVIRAAIFGAALDQGVDLRPSDSAKRGAIAPLLAEQSELAGLLEQVELGSGGDHRVSLVRQAIALDAVRHLHQCSYTLIERRAIIDRCKELLNSSVNSVLSKKLEHAIDLQLRRMEVDLDRSEQDR
jgi:hypothetical protein